MLELLDMAEVLVDAGFPVETVAEVLPIPHQGRITKLQRLQQMLDVANAWTPELLLLARKTDANWWALYEPAVWWRNGDVEREEVEGFAREYVERYGRWPRTDHWRRRFGHAPNHKSAGELTPGQETLLE